MKPYIIIPVFNRKKVTLDCLRVLSGQGVMKWASVLVVDDGSKDGTAEEVRASFPEVQVLDGGGDLWWGRAINLGMQFAIKAGATHLIWLNDDCHPRPGTLELLLKYSTQDESITTAQCQLRETGAMHYGGLVRDGGGVRMLTGAVGELLDCESICGNCVCIPCGVVEKIGFIDVEAFPHFAGDADFGFRAKNAGFRLRIVCDAVCDSTYGSAKNRQSWLLGDMSVIELWRLCFHPMNGTLAMPGLRLKTRHLGVRGLVQYAGGFVRLVAISVIRLLIPKSWLRKTFGASHTVYQQIEAVKMWEGSSQVKVK